MSTGDGEPNFNPAGSATCSDDKVPDSQTSQATCQTKEIDRAHRSHSTREAKQNETNKKNQGSPIKTIKSHDDSILVPLLGRGFLKKNQNAPRPSEHPPVIGEKMSKRLGGIKGCKYKTSSWHLNRFPDADNIGSTCFIAVPTLWLNLSTRCLSWFTGRFNRPTPSDSTPSSRLWCIPTQCAALPFLSGLSPLRSLLLYNPGVHAGALGFDPRLPVNTRLGLVSPSL